MMMMMWVGSYFDVVQSRISKASRISTTPEGAGWKTSMVPRVSMMPVVPRVSVMLERMPDEIAGKSKCASSISTMPKRRGVEDVDGVADADDFDVAAGVKDVGRVHGGGRGALRWRRPW